ncbi:MAG: hypothetical protein AAF297_03020 [Planctomycetota bacterium]
MNTACASLKSLVLASSVATAQSVATYSMVADNTLFTLDDPILIEVYGQADAGQIGNGSGINGVNLRVDVFGMNNGQSEVDPDSIFSNGEVFGATNVVVDDGGFDISFSANSFAGNNFSAGLALFSFEVRYLGGFRVGKIMTSQGNISNFAAATGLPGAFQPSVAYDQVNFAQFTTGIWPTPGPAAAFGLAMTYAVRRRRTEVVRHLG